MTTLILKIPMNPSRCVDDKDEIYKVLRLFHADIEDDELRALMDRALKLELEGSIISETYEIVED